MHPSRSKIIWLSGPHSPLKAGLAAAMRTQCRGRDIPALMVGDGQVMPCSENGCEATHRELHQRLCRLVLTLSEQGHPVIVNTGPVSAEASAWNRENLPGYFEVHTDAGEVGRGEPHLRLAIPLEAVDPHLLAADIVEEVFGRGCVLPTASERTSLPDPGPSLSARAV